MNNYTLYLTGSSGGLGSVTRTYFLERAWNVVGMDVFDDGFKDDRFFFQKIDSANENSVELAFQNANTKFGDRKSTRLNSSHRH